MHANEHDRPRRQPGVSERRGANDKQPHAERRLQAYRRHSQQERDSMRQLHEFVQGGGVAAWR